MNITEQFLFSTWLTSKTPNSNRPKQQLSRAVQVKDTRKDNETPKTKESADDK